MTEFAKTDRRLTLFYSLSSLVLLLGLFVSIYATVHHLKVKADGSSDFACNVNATLSCDDVAKSPYSEIADVPVAILGVAFFLASLFVLLLGFVQLENRISSLQSLAILSIAGAIFSLVLAYISAAIIGKFCISCIATYFFAFAFLGIVLVFRDQIKGPWGLKTTANGLLSAALVAFAVVAIYRFFDPQPAPAVRTIDIEDQQKSVDIASMPGANAAIPVTRSAYGGLGEDYRKGPDDAKVVIVEFVDFQCPACSFASNMLKRVIEEYRADVQVVFRNFPLDGSCNRSVGAKVHPHACDLAKLGRCVGEIGKFWQFHDLVFASQSQINATRAKEWAISLGLTAEDVDRCLKSKYITDKIKEDVELALRLGVQSTPSLFINGQAYEGGLSIENIRLFIDRILKR